MRDLRRNDIELYHEYGLYEPIKVCEISGDITKDLVDQAIKNLNILDNLKDTRDINIELNSEGGCIIEGMRLFDRIRNCKRDVNITVTGQASSMASIILQAGDTRLMTKNSFLMLHEGQETYATDHRKNIERWIEFFKTTCLKLNFIYLNKIKEAKPRYTMKKLDDLLIFDTILSPSKALELGLIDRIITE